MTQGLLDAQRGPDVLHVRRSPRGLGVAFTIFCGFFVVAGGAQIALARSGALYGLVFVALGLVVGRLTWHGVIVRFERSGSRLTMVWHRGERVLREESLPVADVLHVALETALRKSNAANDTYRLVIGTSSKGDIRLADGFTIGQGFHERQRDAISAFLGVPALATREQPIDG